MKEKIKANSKLMGRVVRRKLSNIIVSRMTFVSRNVDFEIMNERCRIDAYIRQSQSNLVYIEMIRQT